MTEEPKQDDAFEVPSDDELKHYFGSLHQQAPCWRCGEMKWYVANNDEARGVALRCIDAHTKPTNKQLPALCMVCDNCGNIWMIALAFIVRWLKKNPIPNVTGTPSDGQ